MEQLLSNLDVTTVIVTALAAALAFAILIIWRLVSRIAELLERLGESASPATQMLLSAMQPPDPETLALFADRFDRYVKSDNNPNNDKWGNRAKGASRFYSGLRSKPDQPESTAGQSDELN